MNAVYLHDWSEEYLNSQNERYGHKKTSPLEQLKNDFEIGEPELFGVEILLASYTYECYEGDAFVLFRKDGKYYEVNASHCSCYGLEDQWKPEECDLNELKHRIVEGDFGKGWSENNFRDELFAVLVSLDSESSTN